MTEETRKELRSFITRLIAVAEHDPRAGTVRHYAPSFGEHDLVCSLRFDPAKVPSELTTAQQLALSVLVGDEAVLPDALADYLLDKGHEYAVAVAEKARREERRRIVKIIRSWASDAADDGETEQAGVLIDLGVLLDDESW